MLPSKPVIFISSTIYDFRDLRSALKYWLEELGYEVMLSEYNDFSKPLDKNSYEACLNAIERATYFILLIGSRTGGFFNSADKVSITRMEYRTAYDLVKAGKMKLITFVRQDLWNIKDDRKALKELLTKENSLQNELSTDDIRIISKHKSNIVNDAEATFSFLNEIGKIDEMKQAMKGETDFPVANWIHPFSTFQNIIETLSTIFNTKQNLNLIALTLNLKRELYSNLAEISKKNKDGEVISHLLYGIHARKSFSNSLDGVSIMPARYVRWLGMYVFYSLVSNKLSTRFIDQAITTGAFLEFNSDVGEYSISKVHESLFDLKKNVTRFLSFREGFFYERLSKFSDKYAPVNNPDVNKDIDLTVSNSDLSPVISNFDCEENILKLSVGLIKALDGDISYLQSLALNSTSPSTVEAEKIQAETVSIEEMEKWVSAYQ